MKCSYCGTEYVPGAEKCSGCGAKAIDAIGISVESKASISTEEKNNIESQPVSNVNLAISNENVEKKATDLQSNINNSNSNNTNNTNNLKIIIAVLVCIIVCMLVFGGWYFFIKDKGDVKSDKAISSNDVENKGERKDTYNDDSNKNTVKFLNYDLTIPDGFIYNMYDGNDYIQSDECVILYKKYEIDYNSILNNRDKIINKLKEDGLTVKSFDEKRINGQNFIVVVAGAENSDPSVPNVEYGYVFYDLKNEQPVFATITSSTIGSFDEKWFDYVGEFFSSAK